MKKSLVLIEVIFSIALFSIIATYSINIIFNLYEKKQISAYTTNQSLLLETTRLFISKHTDLDNIKYKDQSLYFKNNLLLKNVSKFNPTILNNIINIEICLDHNTICQNWYIKI